MDQGFSSTVTLNDTVKGFIKIWSVNKTTGEKELLVSQPNLILYSGADLMAQSLAGVSGAKISHMYIAYRNFDGAFTPPTVDKANSVNFSNYGSGSYSTYGYVRLPLAYTPSFIGNAPYDNNIPVFTAIISTTNNDHGADFRSTEYDDGDSDNSTNPISQIFQVGLAAAFSSTSSAQDVIFSKANFSPITYDPNFNLTITWGVQFLA